MQAFTLHLLRLVCLSKALRPVFAEYSLPLSHDKSSLRSRAIQAKRDTFTYGPSICGNVSYWPAGPLGDAITARDIALFSVDANPQRLAVQNDTTALQKSLKIAGGIKELSDYALLYENQWDLTLPSGVDSGILTNYTQDLLFSMERMTLNPFSIKRLNPEQDSLAFQIDETVTTSVSSTTLDSLFKFGSLFYADYRYQATLKKADTDRYAAACDAYFYIHPESGDFLPLAIRTNVGNDLVYTPADTSNDWLLAKMMFNQNDLWHSQWYHLACTHNVIEIVYEAAFRTLSSEHPIMAILERLSPYLFAYRQIAISNLVNKGGLVDQTFAFSSDAAAETTSSLYNSGVAGSFQNNYLNESLKRLCLLDCTYGPKLKHFPFLEDASVIHYEIQRFMTALVDSYYTNRSFFQRDRELQAWIAEAVPAKIMDFPTSVDRATLINILTHVAYLGSVLHQTLNTNELSEVSGILPFTPYSFYQPVPTTKGVDNLVPFLPNTSQSISQIVLNASFARPRFFNSARSLTDMFNNPAMLRLMNTKVEQAAKTFRAAMKTFSGVVSSRKFDENGLCQGMPFIWRALDPARAPYFLTI